ncbi:hypothetical protein [Nonomuraea sp. MG754425]|uniref:hypothetical protein n=1 Tax=Nonomuraea sp. MG754425 TaxID=2570319 RepID=UPI001F2EFCA7|nr:hypothetical protein [Nonomuraea sp. MG754425]
MKKIAKWLGHLNQYRLRFGRIAIYIEPRDLWVGGYIAPDAVYVLPFPTIVFRWTRRPR